MASSNSSFDSLITTTEEKKEAKEIFTHSRASSSGTNTFKFAYGPMKHEMILQKNTKLLGVKINSMTSVESLLKSLKEELKLIVIDRIGEFHILQTIDNQDIDIIIDKISKKDNIEKITPIYNSSFIEEKSCYIPTGQIYIEFKKGTSTKTCLALLEKHHLIKKKSRGEHAFVTMTNETTNPIQVATELQKDPCIEIAEPDLASKIQRCI